MPIIETDINKFHLSGGAVNADIDASLGGAISTVLLTSNSLLNLFDLVDSDESLAGDVEYRCFYIKNGHPSITLQNAKVWVAANVAGGEGSIDIGAGSSAINSTEQLTGNESSAPSGVVFTRPVSRALGIIIGDLAPGATKAIWVRRTISADSSAASNVIATIGFGGDTVA